VELDGCRAERGLLEAEVSALKSTSQREVFHQGGRLTSVILYLRFLVGMMCASNNIWAHGKTWDIFIVIVFALAGLFILDRSVSAIAFKFGKTNLGIKREGRK
jgi:hypothetical protein